jgi:hypothetical protein
VTVTVTVTVTAAVNATATGDVDKTRPATHGHSAMLRLLSCPTWTRTKRCGCVELGLLVE